MFRLEILGFPDFLDFHESMFMGVLLLLCTAPKTTVADGEGSLGFL